MAITAKRLTGNRGESMAVKYLKKQGYKIVKRNFTTPFGEVDIIAQKDGVLAFVEVKTSLTDIFGTPSERVNANKIRRYHLCANYYFTGREVDCTVRFDIIEVFQKSVNHLMNAFS